VFHHPLATTGFLPKPFFQLFNVAHKNVDVICNIEPLAMGFKILQ
jgi:hypothetical protein